MKVEMPVFIAMDMVMQDWGWQCIRRGKTSEAENSEVGNILLKAKDWSF